MTPEDSAELSAETGLLSARIWSKDEGLSIPEVSLSLPGDASAAKLRKILAKTADGVPVDQVDFLIRGQLLRTAVSVAAADLGLGSEDVLEVEVIRRQPAPTPEHSLPHDDWVSAVVVGPDAILSGAYDGRVRIWSREGGSLEQTLGTHDQPIKAVAWFPGHGRMASASGDQTVIVYKKGSGGAFEAEQVLRGHERSVEAVEVSEDGTRIASGSFDTYLKIWHSDPADPATLLAPTASKENKKQKFESNVAEKSPMVTLAGHKEAVTGLAWVPQDAGCVATVGMDAAVVLWDLTMAGEKGRLQGPKAHLAVAASPITGHLLTASVDRHVRLWDPRSREGSQVKAALSGHSGWVSAVAWSPVRSELFISASYDALLKMWDLRSPKAALYDLGAHDDRLLACDWSEAGRIASGGVDATLKTYAVQ